MPQTWLEYHWPSKLGTTPKVFYTAVVDPSEVPDGGHVIAVNEGPYAWAVFLEGPDISKQPLSSVPANSRKRVYPALDPT